MLNIRTWWISGGSHRHSVQCSRSSESEGMKDCRSLSEPCSSFWFHSGTVLNLLTLICQCVMVDTGTRPADTNTHSSEKLIKICGNCQRNTAGYSEIYLVLTTEEKQVFSHINKTHFWYIKTCTDRFTALWGCSAPSKSAQWCLTGLIFILFAVLV